MLYLLVFAIPLLFAYFLTPSLGQLAQRWGFMDWPREPRHLHAGPTPRLGGLALFLSLLLGVGLTFVLPVERRDPMELARLGGLLLGATIVFLVGLYDDRRELSPGSQLAAQFLGATVAMGSGILITEISAPSGELISFPLWFSVLFTYFWLMGMMNTLNWLDGVDGLATGVSGIAAILFFIHALNLGQTSIALLPLALAGACLGFLPHNFSPARVFMGTAGSLFLGFTLGSLSIIGGAKAATALLVLGIPILDVAWQILFRLRHGRSPFLGDRGHLHHRLLDMGFSPRRVLLFFYLFALLFGGLALLLPSGIYKLYALLILGGMTLAVLLFASRNPPKG
ncbi:MAG: undecaprenyl/decaprenyl-phosphate alpha-N-acetylglucosaminyl 1-phosphate transferase [Chloroflexi bacterium]|nr:undecaprenyl/decaprenyl-phosphate alpha-N-acetylglucosaminyl 1-phosphate transferase [Chloroflexota bacterium]